MSKAMTIAEAKAHFSECVRLAEGGETVVITRHGRPAAAIVSAQYRAELETDERKTPEQHGLASLVGRFPDGAELVTALRGIRSHTARPKARRRKS